MTKVLSRIIVLIFASMFVLIPTSTEARINMNKKPLKTYTAKRVECGVNYGKTSPSYFIDPNVDLVTIEEFHGTWARGTYPNAKGKLVRRWFRMSDILYNINYSNWIGKASRSMPVYRMNRGNSTIGSVPVGEPLEVVSENNGRYQVIYVLSNGQGYKMGWVPRMYVAKIPGRNNVTDNSSVTNNTNNNIVVKSVSTKINEFIHDPRWKVNTSWGYYKAPYLVNQVNDLPIGCAAYCADYAAYVYGASGAQAHRSGKSYDVTDEIRTGDVVAISGHWLVVLGRSGNVLDTISGNLSSKVCRRNYVINGDYLQGIYDKYPGKQFVKGYHH